MVISKKIIFTVLLVLGLFLGFGAVWVWNEYKDDVTNIISNDDDKQEYEDEFDTPYFAPKTWGFGFPNPVDNTTPWEFFIFQPKVVEYKTVDGLNYMVVGFKYGEDSDAKEYKMEMIISRQDEWSLGAESLNRESFEKAVSSTITMRESFNTRLEDRFEETEMSFEDVKEKFPVGSRVVFALSSFYPAMDGRSSSVCTIRRNICDYAKVLDVLSPDLQNLYNGDLSEDGSVMVPYYISDDLYQWSKEGVLDTVL